MSKQSTFNISLRRPAMVFTALALLLAITLLLSPSARAFASNQMRQIGAFLFRANDGSVIETEPQPTIPAPSESRVQYANDAAEASELAGFTVLTPDYLPAGYSLKAWSVDEQDSGIYVVASFTDQDGRHFLIMNQTLFEDDALFEQRYGENETVSDVTVGGHAGVFISGRFMVHPEQPEPTNGERPDLLSTNWLVWEANGITYSLFGDALEQSELLRIAVSLSS